MERLAREMSAVTRVIVILERRHNNKHYNTIMFNEKNRASHLTHGGQELNRTNLPSNRCFKKSNSAFCIISVTWNWTETWIKIQDTQNGNTYFENKIVFLW